LPEPVGVDLRTGVKWIGLIAGQATLVAALLFYFGWVRTQSLLTYFGLDNNIVQLSWNDYVLRSPNVVIRGLTLSCAVLILLTLAATRFWSYWASRPSGRRWLSRPSSRSWLSRGAFALAAVAFVLGVLGFFNLVVYSATFPFVPIFVALSVALGALGSAVSPRKVSKNQPAYTRYRTALGVLVVSVGLLSIFWIASVYATQVGRELGQSIEQHPAQRPRVTVYSETDLAMGPSATSSTVTGSRYTRRYSGLRLLIYASGKYMLIPDAWRRGRDPVYIIPDDAGIRVEITR